MKKISPGTSLLLHCQRFLAGLIILSIVLGCAPKRRGQVSIEVYEGKAPKLKDVDRESLKGKRIVIDPGHGGVFRGAIGRSGVSEADINLGVGLYLWGMLEEAGCDVWLTRKTDKDFVDGNPNRLREDLRRRVEMANVLEPDLFISLHHNADPNRDPTRNEIQIYYKMDDTGPSRDIALAIAKHIRLAIADVCATVKPGNYYVLRNSKAPAVLCEPSFISNPEVESKLRLSEKQRLEAEVYFAAIAEYFSRGVPKAISYSPIGVHEDVDCVEIVFESYPPLDPNSAEIEIDGSDLEGSWLSPTRFVAPLGQRLSNGTHSVTAYLRSTTGNSSPRIAWNFVIDRPTKDMFIDLFPRVVSPGFPQAIFVRPVDAYGNSVRDSTEVSFVWQGGRFQTQVKNGYAIAFRGKQIPSQAKSIRILSGEIEQKINFLDDPTSKMITGFVYDNKGNPIRGATIVLGRGEKVFSTQDSGFFFFEEDISETVHVSKKGYRKVTIAIDSRSPFEITLEPFYKSLSVGEKVAIDPKESLGESSWTTKEGRTSSELNLELATYLRNLLEQYGIDAILTRKTDDYVPDIDRVRAVESFGAQILISIGHEKASEDMVTIEHYPSSAEGRQLANAISNYFGKVLGLKPRISETSDYIIQQTSCPAVSIRIGYPNELIYPSNEAKTYSLFQKCYPIACGLLESLGVKPDQTFQISGEVYENQRPASFAILEIDGCVLIPTGKDGRFSILLLENGCHKIRAFSQNRSSSLVSVCSSQSGIKLQLE